MFLKGRLLFFQVVHLLLELISRLSERLVVSVIVGVLAQPPVGLLTAAHLFNYWLRRVTWLCGLVVAGVMVLLIAV